MKWIPLNSKLDGECGIVEVAGKKKTNSQGGEGWNSRVEGGG